MSQTIRREASVVVIEMRDGKERAGGIQVIARAAAILRALEGQEKGLSLGQIAKLVDLPRSTVQRLVDALEAEELVSTHGPGGGVRLGMAVIRLAASVETSITTIARPHMEELSLRVGESVNLSVLKGGESMLLEQAHSDHPFRVVARVGLSMPAYAVAGGKALLATLPDEEVAARLGKVLVPCTSRTLVSLSALREALAEIRRTGFSYDLEEYVEGICAVATCFRDARGGWFALSISAPAQRFLPRKEQLRDELEVCRAEIEAAAGRV
jgi:DNA-binding IclR family transcriptional regulator